MSASNSVTLIGNIGNELELQSVGQAGSQKLEIRLAVRKYNKLDPEDKTDWFTAVAWNKVAERMLKFDLQKGSKVLVQGSLVKDQWEQDGQKREKIYVLINDFEPMSRNGGTGGGGSKPALDDFDETDLPAF